MSTFNSQTTGISTSTTSSAERYNLDTEHARKILVYRLRGGYEVTTEKALSQELDKAGSRLRLTTKKIPPRRSRLNVITKDLLFDDERAHAEDMRSPNQTSSVANIGLSPGMYLRRLFLGQFTQLYIVSPNSSKSLASSQDSSAFGSTGSSSDNSPEDGPTRAGTGDVLQPAGR